MSLVWLCLTLVTLTSPNFSAAQPPTLPMLVRQALPTKLRDVVPGRTTRAQAQLSLGKAAVAQDGNEFYELAGRKYDTTISFEKGKVSRIHHQFVSPSLKFDDIVHWVTTSQREAIDKELGDATPGPESGLYFSVAYARLGIELKFENTSTKELYSVVLKAPVR